MSDSPESAGPVGRPPTGCELRVHGIGSHGPLSALGAPTIEQMSLDPGGEPRVNVYLPPAPVRHGLRLLNWSRVTRRGFGPGWWFFFPLTLANAAGYASPDEGDSAEHRPGSVLHRYMMGFWSAVLTVGYLLWTFALIETLPRSVPYGVVLALEIAALSAYSWGIWSRIWKRQGQPAGPHGHVVHPPKRLWLLQLAAVLAVGVAVLVMRPASEPVGGDPRATNPGSLATSCWNTASAAPGPVITGGSTGPALAETPELPVVDVTPVECSNRIDVLSGYVVVTTVVATIGIVAVALGATSSRLRKRSSFRATLIVSISVVLSNTVFSGLRTGLNWLSRYLEQIPGIRADCLKVSPNVCFPVKEAQVSLVPPHGSLDWPTYDLVPTAIIWFAALAAVAFVLLRGAKMLSAHLQDRTSNDIKFRDRVAAATRLHDWVDELPGSARWISFGIVIALFGLAAVTVWIASGHQSSNSLHQWFVLGAVHFAALIVPLLVLAMLALGPVRTAVSTVGDVIGYWPRGFVALSGTSYTNEVCGRIEAEVRGANEPMVIVGHSQGSVLGYTTLMRMSTPDPTEGAPDVGDANNVPRRLALPVALVTCGSPLRTLYTGFFPSYFRHDDYVALRAALDGNWTNCWRPTDPIASPVFAPEPGDREIQPTLDFARKLTKHSYYWNEEAQIAQVDAYLGSMASSSS